MSATIEPALTPEEWEYLSAGDVKGRVAWKNPVNPRDPNDLVLLHRVPPKHQRAVAALCLLGYFSWEDVELLRRAVVIPDSGFVVPGDDPGIDDEATPLLNSIADRIAALLPPKEETP